jgi:hypothetical protein
MRSLSISGIDSVASANSDGVNNEVYIARVTSSGFDILGETQVFDVAGAELGKFTDTVVLSGAKSYTFGTAVGDIEFINGAGTNLTSAGDVTEITSTVVSGTTRHHHHDPLGPSGGTGPQTGHDGWPTIGDQRIALFNQFLAAGFHDHHGAPDLTFASLANPNDGPFMTNPHH